VRQKKKTKNKVHLSPSYNLGLLVTVADKLHFMCPSIFTTTANS